ncbi:hypothetical protein FA13DRAFT_1800254 [Coprinellus micaceus]|uniref:Uncharacterized protein n=1 Tax=Coprinellus micaceus TaxID=71717 RepID=A0A4Y7SHA3_COPMI|nr:hypothetical protein FA13DRAFT_1800254 [Coprinellus micaceus]
MSNRQPSSSHPISAQAMPEGNTDGVPDFSDHVRTLRSVSDLRDITINGKREDGQQVMDYFLSCARAAGRVYAQSSGNWPDEVKAKFTLLLLSELAITHSIYSHLILRFPSGITVPAFYRELTVRNIKHDGKILNASEVGEALTLSQTDPEIPKHQFCWWTSLAALSTSTKDYARHVEQIMKKWPTDRKHFPLRIPTPSVTLHDTITNIQMLTGTELLSYMTSLTEFREEVEGQMATTLDAMTRVWVELQRFQTIARSLADKGREIKPPLLDLKAPPEATFTLP